MSHEHADVEALGAAIEMGHATELEVRRYQRALAECDECRAREARRVAMIEAIRAEPTPGSDARTLARALLAAGPPHASAAPPPRSFQVWALAAAAVLLFAVGLAWTLRSEPTRQAATMHAGGGVCEAVQIVHGRTDEVATVSIGPERCELEVRRGRARFHVDPTAGAKVLVRAGDLEAHVLGTVLEVGFEGDEPTVVVERGRVLVVRGMRRAELHAGEAVDARLEPSAADEATLAGLRGVFALSPGDGRAREAAREVSAANEAEVSTANDGAGALEGSTANDGAGALEGSANDGAGALEGSANDDPLDDLDATGSTELDTRDRVERGRSAQDMPRRTSATQRSPAALRAMVREGRASEARAAAEDAQRSTRAPLERAELWTVIAESYASERAYERAFDTYLRAAESGGGPTSRMALVAAADLALERLHDPARAIGLYEAYVRMSPSGPMAEVATLGRCRALSALDRATDARACAETLREARSASVRRAAEALAR